MVFLMLTLKYLSLFSSVSIADFEQVNIRWVYYFSES